MTKVINNQKQAFILFPLAVILILLVSLSAFVFYLSKKCNETRTFSIGNVDSRFNISADSVEQVAKDAASRWNDHAGKKLLTYNDKSKLKIDLIYDERQAEIDRLNLATQNLETNRKSVETASSKFDQLLRDFQSDLNEYNKQVSYWNSQGGAPDKIYSQLEKTRIDLDKRNDQLISMSKTFNLNVEDYNSDLKNLENIVNDRKNLIITQGLYKPAENKIEIFTFGNTQELRLVFMHELGHAIGLDHAFDDDSIMYYLLEKQDVINPILTSEDTDMVNLRCNLRNPDFYRSFFQRFNDSIR
jgi:hypothetical protein